MAPPYREWTLCWALRALPRAGVTVLQILGMAGTFAFELAAAKQAPRRACI